MRPLGARARIALDLGHRMLYRSDPNLCRVNSQGVPLQLPRWSESDSKATGKGPVVCKEEAQLMSTSHMFVIPQGREAHEKKTYAA